MQFPNYTRIATTDFYQVGLSHRAGRFSSSADPVLIDRSNEQFIYPMTARLSSRVPAALTGSRLRLLSRLHTIFR